MSRIAHQIFDQYEKNELPLFNKLDEMQHTAGQNLLTKGDKVSDSHAENISKQWYGDAFKEGVEISFYCIACLAIYMGMKEISIITQLGQGLGQMVGNIVSSDNRSEGQKLGHIDQSCQTLFQQTKDYQRLIDQWLQQTDSHKNNVISEERLKKSNN